MVCQIRRGNREVRYFFHEFNRFASRNNGNSFFEVDDCHEKAKFEIGSILLEDECEYFEY